MNSFESLLTPNNFFILAALLIFFMVMIRSSKRNKRREQPLRVHKDLNERVQRESVGHNQPAIVDMYREIEARIQNRAILLEKLVEDADVRIRRLEELGASRIQPATRPAEGPPLSNPEATARLMKRLGRKDAKRG